MKKTERLLLFTLLILSIIPVVNLLTPGLPVTHDGQDQVARIANFYQSLSEGNLVPRWAGNLNWGYGHPVVMFLYPLPSYIASLFKTIGFSFVDATKLVFAVSYLASVFAMYLWLRSKWGIAAGFIGAILYGFAPYRFVDLYVRGAIGEHVAFIFPPLVLWGLDGLVTHQSRGVILSLATAGLILSHNAVSLMFLPIIGLYLLYLFFFEVKIKSRFLVLSSWFVVLGFMLSAFFWLPAFFEGKYTLRDIVTQGEFAGRFVPWRWFITSAWNYGGGSQFTKALGWSAWIVVIAAIFSSRRRPYRLLVDTILALLAIALFMMTEPSAIIWNRITILQKFQFPWRLLSLTTFLTATLGSIVICRLGPQKLKFMALGLVILAISTTLPMWKAKSYLVKPESFYSGIYEGTTDTGESSPRWSVRFMEKRPAREMELIEGEATIERLKRSSTQHEYRIVATRRSRLVENTLYFPGWRVLVDGSPTAIEFQDPAWRGLMTFWVDPGEHKVGVVFGETKLRRLANALSFVGAVLLFTSLYAKKLR